MTPSYFTYTFLVAPDKLFYTNWGYTNVSKTDLTSNKNRITQWSSQRKKNQKCICRGNECLSLTAKRKSRHRRTFSHMNFNFYFRLSFWNFIIKMSCSIISNDVDIWFLSTLFSMKNLPMSKWQLEAARLKGVLLLRSFLWKLLSIKSSPSIQHQLMSSALSSKNSKTFTSLIIVAAKTRWVTLSNLNFWPNNLGSFA